MPPFQFKPHTWYRGKAKKQFAWMSRPGVPPLQIGTDIYFRVHGAMIEHWTVFDGSSRVVVMNLERMKEYIESVKNDHGFPAEVDAKKNSELNARFEMWVKG